MPTVTNTRFVDRHPFTPDSSLRITTKLTLSPLCFLSCCLYPTTSDASATCGCITRIYRKNNYGFLDISTNTGTALCSVQFPLDIKSKELNGVATNAAGNYCGSVELRSDFLPLFFGNYVLSADSLKLLPSCCRLIAAGAQTAQPQLLYLGTPVEDIRGGGSSIHTADDGTLYIPTQSAQVEGTQMHPITQLSINGVLTSGDRLAMVAAKGGIPMAVIENTLTIGEA